MMNRLGWNIVILSFVVGCVDSVGNGFRNPPEGAANIGKTGGKIALIDDPSAISHNPANLVDVEKSVIVQTMTLIYAEIKYQGSSGSGKTDAPWKFLPSAFYSRPANDAGWAFGIGMTSPFGQSVEWQEDGPFAFTAPFFAELRTIDIMPTVAYRFNERWQVGAGFDFYYSDLKIKQGFPWGMVTGDFLTTPGTARFEGNGTGIGGRVGLTWKATSKQQFAVTARSPVKVDYGGDFDISEVPSALPAPFDLAVSPHSAFSSEITFPTILAGAYGWRASDSCRLGIDLEWIGFSSFDQLPLDIGSNSLLLPSTTIPQGWKDTITVGIGVEYDYSDSITFRGGYVWLESPIPEEMAAPSLPDADRHLLTIGVGFVSGRHGLDVSYGFGLYDDLEISENGMPAFNGKYDIDSHLLAATWNYVF